MGVAGAAEAAAEAAGCVEAAEVVGAVEVAEAGEAVGLAWLPALGGRRLPPECTSRVRCVCTACMPHAPRVPLALLM